MRIDPEKSRVVRLYCAFQFFFSLLLWLPVFYEYQKRIGLTDPQIFSIQSIYYVVFCLLELPTGLAADRLGPWRCMRDGAVVLVVANLLPIFFQSYAGFLSHFLLIALARSYISGASSAYLYDYLARQDAAEEFKQIEGNARAYGLLGKVVCWAFVGALMEWHLTAPYWLTAIASATSVAAALALPRLKPPELAADAPAPEGLGVRLRSTFGLLRASPLLCLLMLQGVAIFVLSRIVQVNLFQPILQGKAFDLSACGVVMGGMTVFEALGSARPGWVRRWFSDLNAVFVLSAVLVLTMVLMPVAGQSATIALLCLFAFAAGLAYPVQRQLLNDHISDSRYRATLLSIESIVDRAICAVFAARIGGYLAAGLLDRYLVLSAAGSLAALAVLWLIIKLHGGGPPGSAKDA